MTSAVAGLIADYLEMPEIEVEALIAHLRINGQVCVSVQLAERIVTVLDEAGTGSDEARELRAVLETVE